MIAEFVIGRASDWAATIEKERAEAVR